VKRDQLCRRVEARLTHTKSGLRAFTFGGCYLRLHLNLMSCLLFYQTAYDRPRGRSNRQVAHQEVHLIEAFLEG
jgi:hypothetical protein